MFNQTDTSKEIDAWVVESVSESIDKTIGAGKGGVRGAIADTAIHATGLSGDVDAGGRTQASRTVDRTIEIVDEVRENVATKAGTATFQAVAQKVNDGFKSMKDDKAPVETNVSPGQKRLSQEDIETLYPSW